jgi:hypothetical protein
LQILSILEKEGLLELGFLGEKEKKKMRNSL